MLFVGKPPKGHHIIGQMKKVPNYQALVVSCGDMPYNAKTKHPNNHPCMVELQVVHLYRYNSKPGR